MTRKLSSVPRTLCILLIVLLCFGTFCLVRANASYTINFIDHDGTIISTQTVKYKQDAEPPADPIREGHTFISWEGEYLTVEQNAVITAIYEINHYQIDFIDHDGTVISSQIVAHGEKPTLPPAPTREGYTFTGWNGEYDTANTDTTITANYEINQYQIDFVDHDGTSLSSQTVTHGDKPTLPETPEREGHTFIGYDVEPTAATSDTVYTAQYQINQYTIQFINYDGTVLQEDIYDHDAPVSPPSNPVKPSDGNYNYTFNGWDKAVTAANADTVYKAQYKATRIVCSYCGSENHKVATCAAKSVSKGALGRWSIPSVGINVACYKSWEQSVCDAKDSACYFTLGDMDVIGDHWNQGFNAIKSCTPGTKAYLETSSGTKTFVCTKIFTGHNTGNLTDDDYNDISRGYNTGGITCYTCNDHWSNVTIVFFQPA